METKKKQCPFCGAEMFHETRPKTLSFKGHSITVDQPGFYCSGCSEALLSAEDLDKTEKELKDFRDKHAS